MLCYNNKHVIFHVKKCDIFLIFAVTPQLIFFLILLKAYTVGTL